MNNEREDNLVQEKIEEIRLKIKNKKIAIFCGAGISIESPSNLPSGWNLRNYLLEKLIDDNKDQKKITELFESSKYPFEAFIQTIEGNLSIIEMFPLLFEKGKPNKNHFFLATLMKESHVNNIMTTNFDEKIEAALEDLDVNCSVYFSEKDYEEINSKMSQSNIFKIHGTIKDISSIRSTIESISSRNPILARNKILELFFKNLSTDILIIGYSASDEFDINPLLHTIKSDNSIYFIKHTKDGSKKVGVYDLTYPFENFKGHTICCDTRKMIDFLWDSFVQEKFNIDASDDQAWKDVIDKWIQTQKLGWKLFTTAHLLFEIQEYKESMKYFSKSLIYFKEKTDDFGIMITNYNIGRVFQYLENYEKGLQNYNKSLELARQLKNDLWTSNNLHQIGTIHYLNNKLDSAERNYYESLRIREKLDDERGIAASLQQIGRIWQKKGEYYVAIAFYENCLIINENLGIISEISKTYHQMGLMHQNLGNYNESERLYNLAYVLVEKLGDQMNMCRVLNQLGNIYYLKNEIGLSKEKYQQSLELAYKIGYKEGIVMAENNLKRFKI